MNGTFGVGKTTTARLVVDALEGYRAFDPEWVGYLLLENLKDIEFANFQELPSWRRLVPVLADEILAATGQDLVAVQTVLDETYWTELRGGLQELGHKVFHVVLVEGLRRPSTSRRARSHAARDKATNRVWLAASDVLS